MITFSDYLTEKKAFVQHVLDKLTPSEQAEFIEFLQKGDSSEIMKLIRSVHKKSNSLKGKTYS